MNRTGSPPSTPQVGSLVTARGRDWIVLPNDDPDVIRLRPLTGGDQDVIGIFTPIEPGAITPASFTPPDPARTGDAMSGLLLRDAARLSLRSGAAPFCRATGCRRAR